MTLSRRSLLKFAGAATGSPILPLAAQDWPSRPIRILVGTAAGGSPDIVSRLVADKLTERLGWTIAIENNTTGAGAVAQQIVSRSPPDGYTMLMMTAGYPPQMAIRNLGFDPLDGYSYVTTVCGYPMAYAVAPAIADPVVQGFAGAGQGRTRSGSPTRSRRKARSITCSRSGSSLRPVSSMTPIPYRGRRSGAAGCARRPRRSDGRCRAADVPAHHIGAVAPAGLVLRRALSADAASADGRGNGARHRVLVVARPGDVAGHATSDRGAAQRARSAACSRCPTCRRGSPTAGSVASPSTPQDYRDRVEREIKRWQRVITAAGIKVEMKRNPSNRHDHRRQIRLRRADPVLGPLSRPAPLAGAARDLSSGRRDRSLVVPRAVRRVRRALQARRPVEAPDLAVARARRGERAPSPRPASSSWCGRRSKASPST